MARASQIPARWQAGFKAINIELEHNLLSPSDAIPFFHARPSPKYDAVYLWDSAFISLIWKHRDPNIAKDILRSVIHTQQPDGRIPHTVNIFGTSQWTQPPLLSWAAEQIASSNNDADFAREVFPSLLRFHDWLFKARRTRSGLFFWDHPYESGIDNSPRFGARDESSFVNTHNLEAIDLSSYAVMDSEALAGLANLIAKTSRNFRAKPTSSHHSSVNDCGMMGEVIFLIAISKPES